MVSYRPGLEPAPTMMSWSISSRTKDSRLPTLLPLWGRTLYRKLSLRRRMVSRQEVRFTRSPNHDNCAESSPLHIGAQDTTPSMWDTKFFRQTQNAKAGIYSFTSDINLSNKTTQVGKAFTRFGQSKSKCAIASISSCLLG